MNPSPRHLPGGSPDGMKSSQYVFSTAAPFHIAASLQAPRALPTVTPHLDCWWPEEPAGPRAGLGSSSICCVA